ncbi:hypothetical protein [Legionella sp. W05-934-2]|jgi:hypothetical protein|uniref:hypothetical protein n=1 Tax=Legionella sp. W05-934-2 TaxID=1198649 RepID=UPI0034618C9F
MNKLTTLLLLIMCQCVVALPIQGTMDAVNIDFPPKQPVVIKNNKSSPVQYMCEMHVNTSSASDNTLFIKQLNGDSVVNGTTLPKGHTLYLTIRPLQTLSIIANQAANIQFTNLGAYLMRGNCYISP